ncbi:MAG: hypothetical protein KDI90_07205 [Alphaproteobacteria bacterium]|nr:hypothetical protein [Alphaproteobacteria bacterium]MCB9974217.1 hypothetical protein [Rhodospirillales bacterium]
MFEHIAEGLRLNGRVGNNLRAIAKDPEKKRVFLDTLGDLRDEEFIEPGDRSCFPRAPADGKKEN